MTPLPGDIISTGSPGAAVVRDGYVVSCQISGFKTLTKPVKSKAIPPYMSMGSEAPYYLSEMKLYSLQKWDDTGVAGKVTYERFKDMQDRSAVPTVLPIPKASTLLASHASPQKDTKARQVR